MARRERAAAGTRRGRGGDDAGEETRSLLLVPVWIGLFLGSWWGLDRLLAGAPEALRGIPALAGGARALAGARQIIGPILGLLLGSYAIVLLGALRRRLRGEPSPCAEDEPPRRARDGIAKAARDDAAIAGIRRELDRAVRAERSGLRRAALAVNNRLMLGALRRRGYNDDIGCGGIVALLVAATVALPFAAEALGRAIGLELAGPLGALLWFALVYAAFGARWVWRWRREARAEDRPGLPR
jgi:hypothetical protein